MIKKKVFLHAFSKMLVLLHINIVTFFVLSRLDFGYIAIGPRIFFAIILMAYR